MLDLKPTDPVCIRSTLEYLIEQARKYNTSILITFDQQLWCMAYMIIESKPSTHPLQQIVLLLGGFRAEASTSFLGTIGSIMDGAGLKEAITTVYAEGSVDRMLTGKAISRAARSRILVDNANTRNKSNFLAGLGKWLAESKCKVVQSPADADLLIAQTAIGLAELSCSCSRRY